MLVACIASGASLREDDVRACYDLFTIAVKESVYLAPWADACYCADWDWWDLKKGLPEFNGQKWTCAPEAQKKWGINLIEADSKLVWGTKDKIATGGNSGFQAMNLAYLWGASGIILLGYDYGHSGKKHWFDDTKYKRDSRSSNYEMWLEHMRKAAKLIPIPVYNCTRETNIDCFKRMTVKDAIRLHSFT